MDNRRRMMLATMEEPFTEIDIFNIATYNGWVTPEFQKIFGNITSLKNTDPNDKTTVYSLTSEGIRLTKSKSNSSVFAYQKLIDWSILNAMAGVNRGYIKIEASYPDLTTWSYTTSSDHMWIGFCTYPYSWQSSTSYTTYNYLSTIYKDWHTYTAPAYPNNSMLGLAPPYIGYNKILIRRIYWSANP